MSHRKLAMKDKEAGPKKAMKDKEAGSKVAVKDKEAGPKVAMKDKEAGPKVTIQNSDMAEEMLENAIEVSFKALKKHNTDVDVAEYIKSKFDQKHGPVWMCVVGKSFGVYVTHQANYFSHFYVGQKAIVLFKGL